MRMFLLKRVLLHRLTLYVPVGCSPTRMGWQVTKMVDMVRAKLLLEKFTIYRNISEYRRNKRQKIVMILKKS